MADSTVEKVRGLMNKPASIRNVSVIGHVDHGKSILCNSLIAAADGLSEKEPGERPTMATRKDEQERGTTLKSTSISLCMHLKVDENLQAEGTDSLINLVDSPGHADFSPEVTAALRITDGALVVVDFAEGVSVQTETLLQQALAERVKPVLVINKVDCALLDLHFGKEELFQSFSKTVGSVNDVIATHYDKDFADVQVSPAKGSVAFGSGLQGWAFTVPQFASKYAKRFGVDKQKLTERLWGESYFNPHTKKWTKNGIHESETLERAFNQFCLDPIFKIFEQVDQNKKEDIQTLLVRLEIQLNDEERDREGKQLLKAILRNFLPCSKALLEMMVLHLPSPVIAQRYRVESLYEGSMADENATAIRECDPQGPLMVYVSKMVSAADKNEFYGFGRVFAGTIRSGLKVRIQGPNYTPNRKDDLFVQAIERILMMKGHEVEPLDDCPAGNIVGLAGVDQFLLKSGTITTSETAYNLKDMKFSVSPIVQRSIEVKHTHDLPKLVEGLKRLSKADPCVLTTINESGEHVITGTSELHLETCVKDLREDHAGIPLRVSDSVVQYRESVASKSSMTALSKSPNKFNRLWVEAEPLTEGVCEAVDTGKVGPKDDFKARAKVLADDFGWHDHEARRIWCFGPCRNGPNLLVEQTRAVQYLHEIKDSFISGFQWATQEGPIGEEAMRGIRFNIVDVGLFSDTIHRGAGQIIPTVRRVLYASTLLAEPTLLEPIFLADIRTTEQAISGVRDTLAGCRGDVFAQEQRIGTPYFNLKAYLPVKESFGLRTRLSQATQGQAFAQCVFDRWSSVPGGSPLDPTTTPGQIAIELRKRKGIEEVVPTYTKESQSIHIFQSEMTANVCTVL